MRLTRQTIGMLLALVGIVAIFAIATDGTFLSARNISLLSRQMAVTGIAAAGMVLLIVAGQIDLSIGSMAGLCGAVATVLCVNMGWPVSLALLASLGLGGLLGLAQGSLVAFYSIPPFIVTLGGMLVFQGALLGLTRGVAISPPESFQALGKEYLSHGSTWALGLGVALIFGVILVKRGQKVAAAVIAGLAIGSATLFNSYEGLPVPVLLMLVVCAACWTLAVQTPFGRHLYAIGGNRDAAFFAGIPIERRLLASFGIMGVCAALAGAVLTARVGAATADAGRMLELDAIAAAVIGGTSLLGGRGSVWGALLGAAIMASLDNGMSLLNTEAYWQPIIKGAILVLAVGGDLFWRKRRA